MYEVIGATQSRAFRVLWMLEELDQPYTHTPAKPQSPEARAANPSGKVPALRVDGVVLTDSTAILTYLADKHGALTFPCGTVERAKQDSVTHQILDEIDAVLWTAARHSFILPEEQRVPDVKTSLKWEYEQHLARLSGQLQGDFLMGDRMTVPDILLTHCLGWAHAAKFPPAEDHLKAYLKRMRARSAFQKAAAA